MKTEDAKILIRAFYLGETTVEEEQQLLHYFENESIPEELSAEKELFLRLYQAEPVDIPENLEGKLSNLIDQLAQKEEEKSDSKTKKLWLWVSSAAACIVILIASGIILNMHSAKESDSLANQNQTRTQIQGIITDPDMATKEAEKALMLVSKNFNKGTEQLALVSENMDKANHLIEKQLKTINNHRKHEN